MSFLHVLGDVGKAVGFSVAPTIVTAVNPVAGAALTAILAPIKAEIEHDSKPGAGPIKKAQAVEEVKKLVGGDENKVQIISNMIEAVVTFLNELAKLKQ